MSNRILFVGVSSMKDHAGQHKLYFLADAFGRRGIPVTVFVPDLEENRTFFADKPHVQASFYPGGSALADARAKSAFVSRGNWSAIWVVGVGIRSFVLRVGRARGTPIIKDFDEFPSMIASFSRLRRAYLRWIERRMIAQADGFTCASELLETTVRKQRNDLGTRVLRLRVAISEQEHRVDAVLVRRLKAEAGDRKILLYVGSVHRMYTDQLDEIIALAGVLKQRGSASRLRVLGGGPDLDYFRSKSETAEVQQQVDFIGHVPRDQLASHMEAADVLVFPFAANPFNLSRCPTKAFHYAAANRPLVTNRTGEVAALFGNAALYYPERDVEALANCCEQALAMASSYQNGIAFSSLTWNSRADSYLEWLNNFGWAPNSASKGESV